MGLDGGHGGVREQDIVPSSRCVVGPADQALVLEGAGDGGDTWACSAPRCPKSSRCRCPWYAWRAARSGHIHQRGIFLEQVPQGLWKSLSACSGRRCVGAPWFRSVIWVHLGNPIWVKLAGGPLVGQKLFLDADEFPGILRAQVRQHLGGGRITWERKVWMASSPWGRG